MRVISIFLCHRYEKGWTYIEKSLNDGKAYVDELDKVIRGGKWEIVTLWKTQSAVNTNIIGEKVSEEWIAEGDETMKITLLN